MAFREYLDYEEYIELGGTVSEDAFPNLERKAQRWLDYFTFDRIKSLTKIPDEVKEVLTEYVNRLNDYSSQAVDGAVISQYSNGVENITYRRSTEQEVTKGLQNLAIRWLPDYLVNRSVNFDVTEYLQPDSNNL